MRTRHLGSVCVYVCEDACVYVCVCVHVCVLRLSTCAYMYVYTYVQCEATPLWDKASAKPHVVAVDEGAGVAMAIHCCEVYGVAGATRLALFTGWD